MVLLKIIVLFSKGKLIVYKKQHFKIWPIILTNKESVAKMPALISAIFSSTMYEYVYSTVSVAIYSNRGTVT
jgi:hypothetical protein